MAPRESDPARFRRPLSRQARATAARGQPRRVDIRRVGSPPDQGSELWPSGRRSTTQSSSSIRVERWITTDRAVLGDRIDFSGDRPGGVDDDQVAGSRLQDGRKAPWMSSPVERRATIIRTASR